MSRQIIGLTSRWLAARAVAGILLGMAALAPEAADAQTKPAISVSASATSVVGDGQNQVTIVFSWTGTISAFPDEPFDFEILDPDNGFDIEPLSAVNNEVQYETPDDGMGPINIVLTTQALSSGDPSRTLTVRLILFPGSPYVADPNNDSVDVEVTAPPPPLPVVTVTATSPHPGPRDLVFTLTRTGSTASSLPVNIALTGDQDAYSNSAWNSRPSMATFEMGESTTQVVVGTRSQRDNQLPITLTVEPGSGYEVGNPGDTVTVLVGDPLRTMTIAHATGQAAAVSEGDTVMFSLTLDSAATEVFTSRLTLGADDCVGDDNANLISGDDIQSGTPSVSVSWAIGDTAKAITVVTLEDTEDEPDEWICLGPASNSSDPPGAFGFAGTELMPVRLNNVDPGPEVSVSAESATVAGDGTNEVVINLAWTGDIATNNSFVFDLDDPDDAINDAKEGVGRTQAVSSARGPQAFRFTTNMLADGAAGRQVTFILKDGDGYRVASSRDRATVTVIAPAPAVPPQNMMPIGNVLISNTEQGDGGARRPGVNSYAQGFVTGNNNGGYTLSSIVIFVSSLIMFDDSVNMEVTINEAAGSVPSDTPFTTLTNPATYTVGYNTFTASGTVTLAKDTRYFIVVRQNVSQGGLDWMRVNPNDNNPDSGAASGWSIDDEHMTHTGNERAGWGSQPTRAMKIQVRGSAVTPTNSAAVGSPTISGDVEVGEELTAVPGTITDGDGGVPATDDGFNYQWQRETASGTWEDISGATSISYTLDMVDMGLRIRVVVSFTDSLSNNEELVSSPTATVAAASDDPDLPAVTVTAKASSVVGGQESAEFTLTRNGGDLANPLMVVISVTGTGVSDTSTPPTTATFPANMATVLVSVSTNTLEAGVSSQVVSLTIQPDSGSAYTVGSANMATVSVEPMSSGDEPDMAGAALVHAVAGTGRAAATEIVDSIWRRADARRAKHMESQAMLGGRVLDTRALSSGDADRTVREVASLLGLKASDPGDSLDSLESGYSYGGDIDDYRAWAEIPDASRIASASSFALPYGHGADDGSFVIWGEYGVTSNESVPVDGASVEAQSSSMTFGFDLPVGGKTLLGLALSRSSGETDYREAAEDPFSTIETSLTSFAPYIHRTMSSGLAVWGSFGMGSGTLTSNAGDGSVDTDVSLQLLAGGARSEVGSIALGSLSLKGDAMMSSTEVDEASSSTSSFAAVDAGTTRARLALELSNSRSRASGSNISFQGELGARLDSGDADEGSGADIAVLIDYVVPGLGLEMRAQSSMMLFHSQEGFEEMGFGFSAIYDPGIAGRGASLSLAPTWNAPRAGAAESMWGAQSLDGHAASDIGAALNARLGYGAETRQVRALATLYGEAETDEEDWRLRLGAELRGLDGPLERLSLDIYGEREETRWNRPHSAVMLEGRLGF